MLFRNFTELFLKTINMLGNYIQYFQTTVQMVQMTLQKLFNWLIQNTEAIVCYSAVRLFCDVHLQSNKSWRHCVGMLFDCGIAFFFFLIN